MITFLEDLPSRSEGLSFSVQMKEPDGNMYACIYCYSSLAMSLS